MKTQLDNAIEALKECPTVNIKGRQYSQVATRVEVFRRHFGTEWGLVTQVMPAPDPFVMVRAEIVNPDGITVATGTAQENRTYGINKTSAIENCETSAIGRALANLGLHGGEYATAEEVDTAIKAQEEMEDSASTKVKTQLKSDMRAFSRDLERVSDEGELEGLLASYEETLGAAKTRVDMPGWHDGAMQAIEAKRKALAGNGEDPAWSVFVNGAVELMENASDLDAIKVFWQQNGKHIAALPEEAVSALTAAKDAAKQRLGG